MSYTELRTAEVEPRKARMCGWCAERIEPGERANFRAYVWQGEFMSDYMHPECWGAMNNYPEPQDLEEGWIPGDFARGSDVSF